MCEPVQDYAVEWTKFLVVLPARKLMCAMFIF